MKQRYVYRAVKVSHRLAASGKCLVAILDHGQIPLSFICFCEHYASASKCQHFVEIESFHSSTPRCMFGPCSSSMNKRQVHSCNVPYYCRQRHIINEYFVSSSLLQCCVNFTVYITASNGRGLFKLTNHIIA
jgi:hypothetical protein